MLPKPLVKILSLDGFILFIEGRKGSGKTNLSMLLAELCHLHKLRDLMATNIKTECYFMSQIDNFPDLKSWLENEKGKKLYILDEAGKHIKRLRFMTEQNTKFMDLVQLIRHYDAGLVGVAPSSKFVDSSFLNTDILDARIRKISLKRAIIHDYLKNEHYFLNDLPKTSVIHNSKDIATFSMKKEVSLSELPLCCQVAKLYVQFKNYKKVGNIVKLDSTQVRRQLFTHLEHSSVDS